MENSDVLANETLTFHTLHIFHANFIKYSWKTQSMKLALNHFQMYEFLTFHAFFIKFHG